MQTAHVNINKEERGNRMYIIQFIRGFCMALADSVPGVSGGTVAFLLGFYDQFIDSIDDLITGNMRGHTGFTQIGSENLPAPDPE